MSRSEMVFGDVTTGPSNDLQVSTALARDMVTQYGMSERLGAVALGRAVKAKSFWPRCLDENDFSEKVAGRH